MLTNTHINYRLKAGNKNDSSLGNMLFAIAGIIGIATKNGYSYGFPAWVNQEYFVNPLPKTNINLRKSKVQPDFAGFDFGFRGFDFPDNIDLQGEFGSWKYFQYCEGLIRHYFTLKPQCRIYKDCILIHYRDYKTNGYNGWADLGREYYLEALKRLPDKKIIVVTDNIDVAYNAIGLDCEYTSNTAIVDFYLLCNADYLIMANSTFSWWGAWLSKAITIAPKNWYDGELKGAPTKDKYLPNWIVI
jgi:hypothetical protein